MLITTTPSIEGKPIQQYLGIVTSEAIIGANIVKDIFAGIRDIVGGRSGTYEKVIEEARMHALQELEEKAAKMGANAVVGVDLDFETIGANGSMLMVVATGTAVRIWLSKFKNKINNTFGQSSLRHFKISKSSNFVELTSLTIILLPKRL